MPPDVLGRASEPFFKQEGRRPGHGTGTFDGLRPRSGRTRQHPKATKGRARPSPWCSRPSTATQLARHPTREARQTVLAPKAGSRSWKSSQACGSSSRLSSAASAMTWRWRTPAGRVLDRGRTASISRSRGRPAIRNERPGTPQKIPARGRNRQVLHMSRYAGAVFDDNGRHTRGLGSCASPANVSSSPKHCTLFGTARISEDDAVLPGWAAGDGLPQSRDRAVRLSWTLAALLRIPLQPPSRWMRSV